VGAGTARAASWSSANNCAPSGLRWEENYWRFPAIPSASFVTNGTLPPEELWRDYNRRADMEKSHRRTETRFGCRTIFACGSSSPPKLPSAAFCCCSICSGEFQRACRFTRYRQPATLRAQVFLCGALLGRAGHRLVLHLSTSWGGLQQRIPLLENILNVRHPNFAEVPSSNRNQSESKISRQISMKTDFNFGIQDKSRSRTWPSDLFERRFWIVFRVGDYPDGISLQLGKWHRSNGCLTQSKAFAVSSEGRIPAGQMLPPFLTAVPPTAS